MSSLSSTLDAAVTAGKLLPSSATNIQSLMRQSDSPIYHGAVQELITSGNWEELNNRFFRTLAFGTGGLRGKTIGATLTQVERGQIQPLDRPEHPCVGTNAMNFFNISRATQGLANYAIKWHAQQQRESRPSVVISFDTRHFSAEFARLAATVLVEKGCDAYLFEAARSTPELSFAVRYLRAAAGINITASHNPPQYNGYKVYFEDGAQVVEPHASGIIAEVNAIEGEVFSKAAEPGRIITIGREIDEAYMERLMTLPLEPELIRQASSLKVVYTPLHGTGGAIIKPMLQRLGFQFSTVIEQETPDGRFPTVKAPNPEYAEALAMAIAQAEREQADIVLATDPDDDRMGAAVRGSDGHIHLLTGNQIGSVIAWYRIAKSIEKGILPDGSRTRGVLIKTFVTTDLQKVIAESQGLRCVETLTGFKYIGEKLRKYEEQIPAKLRENYRDLSEEETRRLRLTYSSLYIFGGEESYGYSGSDFVRDKDANSAVVMFAEVAAYAKTRGWTVLDLLDHIFSNYGFYLERGESLTFDGAEGAAKIKRLVESYAAHPPKEIAGIKVIGLRDFSKETILDSEGDEIPKEAMLMIELENAGRVAVRPSGTEPKIKYYMFAAQRPPVGGAFADAELHAIKPQVAEFLTRLWAWLQKDAEQRLG